MPLVFLEKQSKSKKTEKQSYRCKVYISGRFTRPENFVPRPRTESQWLLTLCKNGADTVLFMSTKIAVRNITRNKGFFQILRAIAAWEEDAKALLILGFEVWKHWCPAPNMNCITTRSRGKKKKRKGYQIVIKLDIVEWDYKP